MCATAERYTQYRGYLKNSRVGFLHCRLLAPRLARANNYFTNALGTRGFLAKKVDHEVATRRVKR